MYPRANRSRADSLIERFDGFAYDYQMHCACGRTSRVPADVYWERESIDALAPCEHCGQEIHFGSAVAALRDPNDLALSNDKVADLAWYHTSTFRDWPSPEYAALVGAQLQKLGSIIPPRIRYRESAKALHVGTYEAAIETCCGACTIRMTLTVASTCTESRLISHQLTSTPDFRDENHEDASQLSLDELGGLRAVRYVNVHEASGSISLAIHPAAINTIQTIALPQAGLAPAPPAHVIEAVARIEEELAAARDDARHLWYQPIRVEYSGSEGSARRG